jgi:hypothetical protein
MRSGSNPNQERAKQDRDCSNHNATAQSLAQYRAKPNGSLSADGWAIPVLAPQRACKIVKHQLRSQGRVKLAAIPLPIASFYRAPSPSSHRPDRRSPAASTSRSSRPPCHRAGIGANVRIVRIGADANDLHAEQAGDHGVGRPRAARDRVIVCPFAGNNPSPCGQSNHARRPLTGIRQSAQREYLAN